MVERHLRSPINLSNNTGFSEHPQISASGNNVYIVWVDDNNTGYKKSYSERALTTDEL